MTTAQDFTLIRTADILDGLCASVDAARVSAVGDSRWLNAISAAWDHLLATDTVEYRHDDHALRYHSESGASYTANGRCSCRSFAEGNACKHRAAAKLCRNALEWNEARDLAARNFTDEADEADEAYQRAFRAGLVGLALEGDEAHEVEALAEQLVADAVADGCHWYDLPTGVIGAQARMASLRSFAATWDAESAAQRTAHAA